MEDSFIELQESLKLLETRDEYLFHLECNLISLYKNEESSAEEESRLEYMNRLESNLLYLYYGDKSDLTPSPKPRLSPVSTTKVFVDLCGVENQFTVDELVQARKSITKDEAKEVHNTLKNILIPETQIIFEENGMTLRIADFQKLSNRTWLNDEIINAYMHLLSARDYVNNLNKERYHVFNTFFYGKLFEFLKIYNYENVKRWTKTFNIFDLSKIFIPLHLGKSHWVLVVVHVTEKKISYYDSLMPKNKYNFKKHSENILHWISDEAGKKGGFSFNQMEWTYVLEDVPQQSNFYDCGVFTLMFADFLFDEIPLNYIKQEDMTTYRLKIGLSILRKKIPYYYYAT